MSDTDSVLFANDAFYQAFADKDMEAMADLWANDQPVSCLHPGWGPLLELSEILSSWAAILGAPEAPGIRCIRPTVQLHGDVGTVVCFEQLPGGTLVATNIFVRQGSLWKMIHHQGGPTSVTVREDDAPSTGAVH